MWQSAWIYFHTYNAITRSMYIIYLFFSAFPLPNLCVVYVCVCLCHDSDFALSVVVVATFWILVDRQSSHSNSADLLMYVGWFVCEFRIFHWWNVVDDIYDWIFVFSHHCCRSSLLCVLRFKRKKKLFYFCVDIYTVNDPCK